MKTYLFSRYLKMKNLLIANDITGTALANELGDQLQASLYPFVRQNGLYTD